MYLQSKVVCLFCFVCTYEIHCIGMLEVMFLVSFLTRRGASAWLHDVWTCGAKVLEY
jgi:hypothetical protein